jgi:NAD(P)-dependent dehydrogenase (short-subunit alcohol dehydrogenase family)
LAVATDVGDPTKVSNLAAAAIERFGRIDVWVNNVGVGSIGYFWDIPIEDHARVVDVNLKGLIFGAHAALNQFRIQRYAQAHAPRSRGGRSLEVCLRSRQKVRAANLRFAAVGRGSLTGRQDEPTSSSLQASSATGAKPFPSCRVNFNR